MAAFFDDTAPAWVGLLTGALITLPLAVRRRFPSVIALFVAAAFIVAQVLLVPELVISNIALFLALYTVGAISTDRRRANLTRAAIVVAMAVWLVVSMFIAATDPDLLERTGSGGALTPLVAIALIQILTNILYFAAAWYFGDWAWKSARAADLLRARTAELEQERERSAAQAVALDRVRIARELHDVVAHHVSVMGVQAGAARTVLAISPTTAAEALSTIEQSARTAIEELRGLLTTLRSDEADIDDTSAAQIERLPELAELSTSSGMPTALTVIGEPHPLSDLTSVNLYRIAQEALTNARRHGEADTQADMRLRYLADAVELEITNTGTPLLSPYRPGLGQLGMRERAIASGGTIEVGPRPRGGWLVRVRVPVTSAAQASEAALVS